MEEQPNNLVHNVKLLDMLKELVAEMGWEEMGKYVNINCFTKNPTMGSSLTFIRKTPWAKEAVQQLYLDFKRGTLPKIKETKVKKWEEIIKPKKIKK